MFPIDFQWNSDGVKNHPCAMNVTCLPQNHETLMDKVSIQVLIGVNISLTVKFLAVVYISHRIWQNYVNGYVLQVYKGC